METLESSSWHRVADLKPRFRPHADIHRHVYRGHVWHIVQDHQSGRYFRISPAAYHLVSQMNGMRTVEEIWRNAGQRWGTDRPTQDETIRLIAQLGQADLLVEGAPTDISAIARRAEIGRSRDMLARIKNPMAIRIPLFDPDRFLSATQMLVRPLFTLWGLIAWLGLIGFGIVTAALNWPELMSNLLDRILVTENLILLVITYPFVKAFHELGHAYAVKVWGGEVHEIGVMLLVFMPVPYVDASSSAAFPEKYQRVVVGAAGIIVEVALAAIAMIVWANAESGLVTAIAFNVMLIGGVSTVLFNGNPLLRFDGYYVLADLIETPNLGPRSNRYVQFLVQTHVLGMHTVDDPATTPGERRWFFAYSVAAFLYRLTIMAAIAMFVAGKFFFFGVVLAIWAITMMLIWPIIKGLKFILTDARLDGQRPRAIGITAAAVCFVLWVLAGVPIPYRTMTQGVVWAEENAQVRAGASGFVSEIFEQPGTIVEQGATLVRFEDPIAASRVNLLEIDLRANLARYEGVRAIDLVQAKIFSEQVELAKYRLDAEKLRASEMEITAPQSGQFVLVDADALIGRYVRKGALLGFVMPDGAPLIRAVVLQSQIDLVRSRLVGVEFRAASGMRREVSGTILRAPPAAVSDVPSEALATSAGGPVVAQVAENGRARAIDPFFIVDIVPNEPMSLGVGERVYVRFDHGPEPVLFRISRSVRRLFLSQFDV